MSKQKGRIGIFFVIGKKVLVKTQSVDSVLPAGGFCDSDFGHEMYFAEELSAKYYMRFTDYTQIPRGRVMYETGKDRFIVYLDKTLNRPVMRAQIINIFQLAGANVIFKYDLHYTTSKKELDEILKD